MRNPKGWHSYEEHFIGDGHYKILENRECNAYRIRFRIYTMGGAKPWQWHGDEETEWETPGGARGGLLYLLRDRLGWCGERKVKK